MTKAEKARYLEDQKKFPYETVKLKDDIVAVKFGGGLVEGEELIKIANSMIDAWAKTVSLLKQSLKVSPIS